MLSRTARTPVALYAAAVNLFVIVFLSLYPFTGWTASGRPLFEFLTYPLPYYVRLFDNAANILIYIPYGFCLALVFHPRWLCLLFALLVAGTTSLGVELLQQFLPSRVASNLDVLFNLSGALLGAILAVSPWCRQRWRHLQRWRRHFFTQRGVTDYALILLGVWVATQLNPAMPLFGAVSYPAGLPQPFDSPLQNPRLFLFALEAAGTACNVLAIGLFLSCFVREPAARGRAFLWLLAGSILVRMLTAVLMLRPDSWWLWLNPHWVTGMSAGVLLVWWLFRLPVSWRAWLAIGGLLGAQMVVLLWPFGQGRSDVLMLFRWPYGHLQSMSALGELLSDLWPVLAIMCLLRHLWYLQHGESAAGAARKGS